MSPGGRDAEAPTHCWVSRIVSPVVFVSCSTRAATLTVSPIRVNSSLPAPPMVPAITVPVLIPMPIRRGPAESFGDAALNQHSGVHCGVGMIGKVVGCPEDG